MKSTKKIISAAAALCMAYSAFMCAGETAFTCTPILNASAAEDSSEELSLEYSELDDGTVEITKYSSSLLSPAPAEIVIPSEIDGKKVTSIGKNAFSFCHGVTSIIIPDTVISIGESAFRLSSNLTSVTIPDSVASIGDYAFNSCSGLTSITIPDSITSIRSNTFWGCSALTSITIPDSVTSIGYKAFGNCSNLASITIPKSVTIIKYGAFSNCDNLASITILNPDCEIQESFGTISNDYDSETNEYYFTGTICGYAGSTAQAYAEKYNRNFVALSGTDDLQLEYSELDDGTIEITKYISSSSTDIVIPSEIDGKMVTGIAGYAFVESNNLTSIYIPDSVTIIGSSTNNGLYCSAPIIVSESNENYSSADGVLFNKDKSELLNYPYGKPDDSYIIPDSVTSINYCAFWNCVNLTSVTIPNSVTNIENAAFSNSSNLTSIIIPDSVTSIGEFPFDGCTLLSSITVSENNKNYSSIDGVLFNKEKSELLLYPEGKPDTSYVIPDSCISIGRSAFSSCDNLTSITIPNSVTKILKYAFDSCINLVSVDIPNSVTSIGVNAFQECHSLASITIPKSISRIEDGTFSNCDSLVSVIVPENVTRIGDSAFSYCYNLAYVTILNRSCTIELRPQTICNGYYGESDKFYGTIYGYKNSTAQKYAEQFDKNFVTISGVNGDVSNNGTFDVSDMVNLQNWLMNRETEIVYWKNGDLNNDNILDSFDIVLMRKLLIENSSD